MADVGDEISSFPFHLFATSKTNKPFTSLWLHEQGNIMSAKAIREFHGKKLASRWLSNYSGDVKYNLEDRALLITASSMRPEDSTNFDALAAQNPWVLTEKLVVKVCFVVVCLAIIHTHFLQHVQ